ncbi:MAG: hypothetical protein ABI267_01625 [Ginsengibacter sp.]
MKRNIFITQESESSWWKSLQLNDMREMAFMLSQKALPAWNNFDLYEELKKDIKSLPEKTLKEIEIFLQMESSLEHKLNQHFLSFVTPVIQIQDGHLKLPFEVKQSFLSVFHILKGVLSPKNEAAAIEAFSSSIKRSIDAIKIAKIMNPDEVLALTNKYYQLSLQA